MPQATVLSVSCSMAVECCERVQFSQVHCTNPRFNDQFTRQPW